jgi:hypothetical protein
MKNLGFLVDAIGHRQVMDFGYPVHTSTRLYADEYVILSGKTGSQWCSLLTADTPYLFQLIQWHGVPMLICTR